MAGLINTQIKTNNDSNSFVGYDPEKITVDNKSTVQGQVADIVASGSKLNQLASANAKSAANRRGLVNSAMAVGAGEKAVIENALPIATQDANTNFNAQLSNQKAGNDATQFTADATNKGADIVARTVAEKDINAQKYKQEIDLQTLRGTQDTGLQTLRGTQQEKSDNIAAQTSRLNTASQSASLIYSQAAASRQAILSNAETDPATKQMQIDALNFDLEKQVALTSKFADIDLSDMFGAAPPPSTPTAGGTTPTTGATQPTTNTTGSTGATTGGTTGPSSDPATQMAADLAAMNASSTNEQEALQKMITYGKQNGYTLAQMAAATGRTLEQAQQRLALYNLAYP